MNAVAARLGLGALALAGCIAVSVDATDGFRILTSARQPAVRALQHPRFELPLRTADAGLVGTLPAPGRLRVVEITYERCRTVCTLQGGALADVFRALQADVAAQQLQFVSLSVDPGDCPAGIAQRVQRLGGGAPGWAGLCVADEAALGALTRRLGVVAIRDARQDYRHTEGVFLVGADGRVFGYEPSLDKQTLVLAIRAALQRDSGAAPHG